MRSGIGRIGRLAACLGAFALAGGVLPAPANSAPDAEAVVADWPETSRLTARAMIQLYGQPRRADADSLTWFGPGAWKRTVLHREAPDGNIIEQAVDYRVPEKKIALLDRFDPRVQVDRRAAELSVRSDSLTTNCLLANLAHEVASGFRTPYDAHKFYAKQMRLEAAGKSSSYLNTLRFELVPDASASPWTDYGTGSAPAGKPWDTEGTPWVVPPGTRLPSSGKVGP